MSPAPRHSASAILRALAALCILAIALAGCSVQLAPAYDEAGYNSLTALNVKTLTLFSALSRGSTAAEFAAYKPKYDELIGGFSAAGMVVKARPGPDLGFLNRTPFAKACGTQSPAECLNVTAEHIDAIVLLLGTMRDTHRRGALAAEVVTGINGQSGFKAQYVSEMTGVLTYEAALRR